MSALRILFFVLTFHAFPALAQETEPTELAGEQALKAALPEQVSDFAFDQASVPPFAAGEEGQESIALNAVYEHEGTALFLVVSQYREPERLEERRSTLEESVAMGQAAEETLGGRRAFVERDAQRITLFVGSTIELNAYFAGSSGSNDDLYAAIESVDMAGLEALDSGSLQPSDGKDADPPPPTAAPEGEPTEAVTGIEAEVDCSAFNQDYKAQLREEMGLGQIVPWAYVLKDEEAATAERADGKPVMMLNTNAILSFPKKGNPWLACVRENDILWAPSGSSMFMARVKAIWEMPERAAFRVDPAGLGDVISRGRIEQEVGGPE